MDPRASRRTAMLANHIVPKSPYLGLEDQLSIAASPCLNYVPPERQEGSAAFSPAELREILEAGSTAVKDEMFGIFARNKIFWPKAARDAPSYDKRPVYTAMDYNTTKEEQREITFNRIMLLRDAGYFRGWLSNDDPENVRRKAAMHEAIGIYDHSMAVKLGVHIHLWGGAVKYLGTKRHHDKWLRPTEEYEVAGSFCLTELGHGSNVRGIETVATYDSSTEEFVINTPCETAQKYWIGGTGMHANHTVAFAQLHINGRNEGVHAFIVRIRDQQGNVMPNIRIADCGHKIGLNGIDNGRVWFYNVRIPRENLLNAQADVTADGRYISAISDPDQRFAAFMAPLTSGRVTIAISAVNQCKIGLAIALRYALTRRAFSPAPGKPETLLLDYPAHQRRLLPLLASTYVMNLAVNDMKYLYLNRKPSDAKFIHVQSSGYKALNSWQMLRILQECREACGGMGVRSDNRVGQLKAEHDVMTTFEGDNVVLMQTVAKAMLGDFVAAKKRGKPIQGKGVEHLNGPRPVVSTSSSRTVIRDPSFLLALFRLRERDLLERLAAQVDALARQGMSHADAFNECCQLGSDLGKAHAELDMLVAAKNVVQRQRAGPLRDVLNLVTVLFALVTVDEDPAFLRYNYLSPEQAQAIHAEVAALCKELRPHTLALVDSFGLPQHLLAPIAFDWVDYESSRHLPPMASQSGLEDSMLYAK